MTQSMVEPTRLPFPLQPMVSLTEALAIGRDTDDRRRAGNAQ